MPHSHRPSREPSPAIGGLDALTPVLSVLPNGALVVAGDGRIAASNRFADDMFGYAPGELTGQPVEQLVPEAQRGRHERYRSEFGGSPREMRTGRDLAARRKDGSVFPVQIGLGTIPTREGTFILVVVDDITERKGMEAALRKEQERLATITETVPGVLYSFRLRADGTTCFPYASPRIKEVFGIPADGLADDAAPVFASIHPDDLGRVYASIARSAQTRTLWQEEFRARHPEKGEIWISGVSTPTIEPDGGVLWFGVITDITERKRADEQLRISQARLVAALEAGGMGTAVLDVAGGRMWFDETALKLWGLTATEVEVSDLDAILMKVHPEDREAVNSVMRGFASGVIGSGSEFRVMRPDGSVQWLFSKGHVERDAEGRPLRLTGVFVDINARKRAEEAMLRTQKLEALGTLAGGIAHDFNNILFAIAGNTDLAMADLPADHPVQQSLLEIKQAGTRATDLVRRILSFSRPQDQKREVLKLEPILQEARRFLRATIPATIDIVFHEGVGVPAVLADSTQVYQAVVNLATNAAHAIGSARGRIDIRLETVRSAPALGVETGPGLPEGRYACLSVSDTGCGMDPILLDRIFDPFFTTKGPGQGTGLGLSVVHGIMKSHRGAVTVESETGRGSTFRLYFPAADGVAVPAVETLSPRTTGRGERILYLDDEPALVAIAQRSLTRLGYKVTGYTSPLEALAAVVSRPNDFDVVITDLAMPRMSGFDFARKVREARPDLPVLMTSGRVGPEEKAMARDLGVIELIAKPDTLIHLEPLLDKLFRADRTAADHSGD
jgi:PAS domain S-box-containing protein